MGCFRDVRREQGSIDNLHMLELSCAVDGCWLAARCCDAAAVLMLVELELEVGAEGLDLEVGGDGSRISWFRLFLTTDADADVSVISDFREKPYSRQQSTRHPSRPNNQPTTYNPTIHFTQDRYGCL